jgi:hypothetical protein
MTSPPRARGRAGAASSSAKPVGSQPHRAPLEPKPFRPQRTLFVTLMIVFVLWVAGLLAMYFTTLYQEGGNELPVPERPDAR